MQNKNSWVYCLLGILILISAISIRVYRLEGKDALFVDENLAVILSNYTAYGWSYPTVSVEDEVKVYEGRDLKNRFFKDDNSLQNIAYDLWTLRKDNRDLSHTNLYYSFLRLSFWGADTADLDDVISRGFLLNLLFFLVGAFFLYRLARLLFKDNFILILCILGFAFLNPISISNTLYLRMYQLQETLFIVLTYFIVLCATLLRDEGAFSLRKKILFGLLVATSLSLLAGFFGIVYIFMLWGGLGIYIIASIKDGRKTLLLQLSAVFVGAIVLLFLVYPVYLDGFSGDRGEEAMGKFSFAYIISGLRGAVAGVIDILGFKTTLIVVLSFIIGSILLFLRKENRTFQRIFTFYIAVCSGVWVVFVMYFAPYKVVRYIAPIMPLLCFIFPFVLSFVTNKILQRLSVVVLLGTCLCYSLTYKNIYWEKPVAPMCYKNDIETPLIIGGIYSPWLQTALVPFYTDGRIIEFTFNMDEFDNSVNRYEQAYVVVGGEEMNVFSIPLGYEVINDCVVGSGVVDIGSIYKVRKMEGK